MSLAAPLFLFGLAALFVPWLLHRLNQQDAPERDFPSAQFLEPTTAISSRKKHLRYRLLLALRMAFLALLCLLFAQPALERLKAFSGDANMLHILVVDKSYSIRQRQYWQHTQETARDILDALPNGTSLQLMSAAANLQSDTDITTSVKTVLDTLLSLKPGFERLHYGELMRQLSAHVAKLDVPVHVHFISDMQSSAIPARAGELINREFAGLDLYHLQLPRANRRITAESAAKLSPDSATSANSAVRALIKPRDENTFDLVAEISRFTDSSESVDGKVSLFKSAELAEEKTFVTDTSGTTVKTFEALKWPAGDAIDLYEITLSPEDALADDNNIKVAVRREPPVEIAIVSNGAQPTNESVDELYLQTALQLDPRNSISVHKSDAMNLPKGVQIVIYLDYLALTTSELPQLTGTLKQLHNQGKHVLYVLNADSDRLDTPGEVTQALPSHPLGMRTDDWQDVRFFAHQAIDLKRDQTALLESSSGYPVVVEQQSNENAGANATRLLWLNAALNGADNGLPVSPVFVPFLRDVIDYFVRADAYPQQISVGEGLRLKKSVQMLDPEGKQMVDLSSLSKGGAQIISRPGTYTILESNADIPVQAVVDMAESDLRHAQMPQLLRWQTGSALLDDTQLANRDTVLSVEETSQAAQSNSSLQVENASTTAENNELVSLTRWLIPACLVLLLLEMLYANRHLSIRRSA